LNAPVLAFSIVMLAVTGLIAGLVPAAQAWRSDLAAAATENSRSTAGGRRASTARRALVVGQIALALPVLVGASLLTRSFSALVRVDAGFRSEGVVTLHLAIPRTKYARDLDVAAFCGQLVERVRAVPGVVSAGMVNRLPLGGIGQLGAIEFEGGESRLPSADWRTVTPGYFAALGIPLREGRLFTERDGADAPPVGIVDEQIARTQWAGQSAVGKRFRIPGVGVPWVVLVVRGGETAAALVPAVVQAVRTLDPEQPVYDVRTMDAVVDRSLAQRRMSTALFGAFAVVSLLLASVGVYGVMAFGVARRVREFGIRVALGARRADLTRLVLREGAGLAGAGIVAGLAGAALLSGAMRSLVYGVGLRDAASFALSAGALLGVAVLASYLPARRAASVDPAVTLRGD
jgi:hypothetical protein